VGTVSLGAGIALAGQTFNLAEHWPSGVLLWAMGAAAAWGLLRDWAQGGLTAILVPCWLVAEWMDWAPNHGVHDPGLAIAAFACALSLTYLSLRRGPDDSALCVALGWIGGICVLPAGFVLAVDGHTYASTGSAEMLAWAVVGLVPLGLAFALRGHDAVRNAIAAVWVLALAFTNSGVIHDRLLVYFWCVVGSVGLAAWGTYEGRAERINLGVAAFAITVLTYFFSDVQDKVGRSASLLLLGIVFLGGGWMVERMRRRLISEIHPGAQ
jgi:hypothetical protein